MISRDSAGLIVASGAIAVPFLLAADRDPPQPQRAVRSAPRVKCVAAVPDGPFAPERSLAAARRALRPQILTNQGGTIHLTPRDYTIGLIASLGPGVPRRTQQRHYFNLVRAQCGEREAERTWLISVNLPKAQLVLPPLAILAARTPHGWQVVHQSYTTG